MGRDLPLLDVQDITFFSRGSSAAATGFSAVISRRFRLTDRPIRKRKKHTSEPVWLYLPYIALTFSFQPVRFRA